jgi:hypothetical protein
MTQDEFFKIKKEGKRYTIDVTLRQANESYKDFIDRAIKDDLGVWIDEEMVL